MRAHNHTKTTSGKSSWIMCHQTWPAAQCRQCNKNLAPLSGDAFTASGMSTTDKDSKVCCSAGCKQTSCEKIHLGCTPADAGHGGATGGGLEEKSSLPFKNSSTLLTNTTVQRMLFKKQIVGAEHKPPETAGEVAWQTPGSTKVMSALLSFPQPQFPTFHR